MNPCLDKIVTLGICPDEEESISGLKLIDAPGISIKNLASTATETYRSGVDLALSKKNLALKMIENDFYGALISNGVASQISFSQTFDTSAFDYNKIIPAGSVSRGVVLYRNTKSNSRLKSLFIKSVKIAPVDSGVTKLYIRCGTEVYEWDIDLVGGQINTFDSDNLDRFPFMVPDGVNKVTISVDQSGTSFYSSQIICRTGCNGTLPNECGYSDGWDGHTVSRREGFGVNAEFYCECDYSKILCDISKGYVGQLIFAKWQIEIFKEHALSNRFNNWVLYNKDQIINSVIPALESEYVQAWNSLMSGMINILSGYRDSCIQCKGIKWIDNI